MSNAKPPSPADDPFGAIGKAAEAANDSMEAETQATRIAEMEAKLAGIEPLLEQLQANSQIGPSLTSYVSDLRDEQVFFNRARYAVGCFAFVAMMGIIALLALAIFHPKSPLLTSPASAIAALVIGLVSGVVLLISAFAKGVFRSTVERHSDGFLPPALEKGVEFLGKTMGKRD